MTPFSFIHLRCKIYHTFRVLCNLFYLLFKLISIAIKNYNTCVDFVGRHSIKSSEIINIIFQLLIFETYKVLLYLNAINVFLQLFSSGKWPTKSKMLFPVMSRI